MLVSAHNQSCKENHYQFFKITEITPKKAIKDIIFWKLIYSAILNLNGKSLMAVTILDLVIETYFFEWP